MQSGELSPGKPSKRQFTSDGNKSKERYGQTLSSKTWSKLRILSVGLHSAIVTDPVQCIPNQKWPGLVDISPRSIGRLSGIGDLATKDANRVSRKEDALSRCWFAKQVSLAV
jgi:hypothetical protein